ncbi:hypothetical protein BH18THE1_BH18THE1_16250 [soil metagenome]
MQIDTHEVLDRKTLRYIYSNVLKLLVKNMENWYQGYSDGKEDAYVDVMRIINDILDT